MGFKSAACPSSATPALVRFPKEYASFVAPARPGAPDSGAPFRHVTERAARLAEPAWPALRRHGLDGGHLLTVRVMLRRNDRPPADRLRPMIGVLAFAANRLTLGHESALSRSKLSPGCTPHRRSQAVNCA
jgi:hypothetical protein